MITSKRPFISTIELLAFAGITVSLVIVILYYNQLPDSIANHFTFQGKPDDMNSKKTIWILPLFGGILYLVLSSVSFFVRMVRRPDDLTSDVLNQVAGMISMLKLVFSVMILYLVIGTVRISLGQAEGLGVVFAPGFLLAIATILVNSIIGIIRKQREDKR